MSVDLSDGNPAMDYREHTRTYEGFLYGVKMLTAASAVTLVGMAVFLL